MAVTPVAFREAAIAAQDHYRAGHKDSPAIAILFKDTLNVFEGYNNPRWTEYFGLEFLTALDTWDQKHSWLNWVRICAETGHTIKKDTRAYKNRQRLLSGDVLDTQSRAGTRVQGVLSRSQSGRGFYDIVDTMSEAAVALIACLTEVSALDSRHKWAHLYLEEGMELAKERGFSDEDLRDAVAELMSV